jgi:hypothetical protein
MLQFERDVVGALGSSPDPTTRSDVEAFVEGSLRAMPRHIRVGVLAGSLGLSTWVLLWRRPATTGELAVRVHSWESSPIGPVRQYVRMFRSLVLFSEHELAPEPTAAARTT